MGGLKTGALITVVDTQAASQLFGYQNQVISVTEPADKLPMFATLRYGQNSTLVEQVNQAPRIACINCRSRKVIHPLLHQRLEF